MKFSRSNILYIALAIVLVGAGVYYFTIFNRDTGAALTSTPGAASDEEQNFINLVGKLDPIVFDTTLLQDPRFTSRTDIRTTVLPESAGRTDPFAPIPGTTKGS